MSESGSQGTPRRTGVIVALLCAAVAIGIGYVAMRRREPPPPPAAPAASEEATRRFFLGLAQLQVGQLDAAVQELGQATQLAPDEAAAWANLGLAQLRQGSHDAARASLDRAAALAPRSADVAYLQARLAAASGRRDEAIGHLRRTIDLDPRHLRAMTALAEAIESSGAPTAPADALRAMDALAAQEPRNVAVLVERARLAAKAGDVEALRGAVAGLETFSAGWPDAVRPQWSAVKAAGDAGDATAAARALAFLRNVLVQVPEFREGRERVTPSEELIADPLVSFLVLPMPSGAPSPADDGLAYAAESLGEGSATALIAVSLDGDQPPAILAIEPGTLRRVDVAGGAPLPLPDVVPAAGSVVPLDWNHDFRMDLLAAGSGGVRLFLQGEGGFFEDATGRAIAGSDPPAEAASGAWAADIEMDGDLDAVVARRDADPVVLRNNGDGTWRPTTPFPGVPGLADFEWGDLDDDGDPDAALLDAAGAVHVFGNLQGGRFERLAALPDATGVAAFTIADPDADGRFDLVMLRGGVVRRAWLEPAGWRESEWTAGAPAADPAAARLVVADLDNNGALDALVSSAAGTQAWLAGEDRALRPLALPAASGARVSAVIDLDGDGLLDLAGLVDGRPTRFRASGTRGHHVHVVRPRAVETKGDGRINTFAIGGSLEMRSGLLVQKVPIDGPVVQVGLGARARVDVTRIVWPNGTPQAEFSPAIDTPIVAQQRLKGSCPWIFADDGTGMKFVTDFIWRSPLGLRINAQDTAGVTQTEDWVKIRGDQLVPRDGVLDVRITAELWETHFIDHASLLVVDHPSDVDVFVDERFVPVAPPALALHATERPRPIAGAWAGGRDVTAIVARRDGDLAGGFTRGDYQGIADDHFVEIDLGEPIEGDRVHWLVAHGFVYPTDSSINMALGQGGHEGPHSLSLEAQAADGSWIVAAKDLGFPAGKNKTVLLDLGAVARSTASGARRLRLRTNLEISWDSIEHAFGAPDSALRSTRLAADRADLRHRGFSVTRDATNRDRPEIPLYDRLAARGPRWRDLEGHYTRYGDVRELLSGVDDRYLIMNAGDEIRLAFVSPPPPEAGTSRDYVLVGDGWVKDGDYNTSFARTVQPLPAHDRVDYVAASASPTLWEDAVFARHRDDWATFHTRHVAPRPFVNGLELPAPAIAP